MLTCKCEGVLLAVVGAAKGLFELDYYKCLKAALKPNGVICSQGEIFKPLSFSQGPHILVV